MKRPLTRKLIVKEQLEQAADPWEILRKLEEKNIYITRMTLWRDMQEVQRCSKDELIYKYEMADIERRKVLRERQKKAVAAKQGPVAANPPFNPDKPPATPDKPIEKPKHRLPDAAYNYQVIRGRELEEFMQDIRDDRYRMPDI